MVGFGLALAVVAPSVLGAPSAPPPPPPVAAIATCGPARGHSYNLAGGLVSDGAAGWSEDGLPGSLSLVDDGAGGFDIVFTGPGPLPTSVVGEGGEVRVVGGSVASGSLGAIAVYSETTTLVSYVFSFVDGRPKEVVFTTTRAQALFSKGAVMRAACR